MMYNILQFRFRLSENFTYDYRHLNPSRSCGMVCVCVRAVFPPVLSLPVAVKALLFLLGWARVLWLV